MSEILTGMKLNVVTITLLIVTVIPVMILCSKASAAGVTGQKVILQDDDGNNTFTAQEGDYDNTDGTCCVGASNYTYDSSTFTWTDMKGNTTTGDTFHADTSTVSQSADDQSVSLVETDKYICADGTTKTEDQDPFVYNYTIATLNIIPNVKPFALWYFDGTTPQNYPLTATVTATVEPSDVQDTFDWEATEGSDKFSMQKSGQYGQILTLTSVAKSDDDGDCEVTVSGETNSTLTAEYDFCVDYPGYVDDPSPPTNTGAVLSPMGGIRGSFNWYQTSITFSDEAKFGDDMSKQIEFNEAAWTNYQATTPNNWGAPPTSSGMVDPSAIKDLISAPVGPSITPAPTQPQTPLSGTAIDQYNGEWRLGSTNSGSGTTICDDQWSLWIRYIDHGIRQ